jgi:uncharacterized protein YndB with AHSA1/START domain
MAVSGLGNETTTVYTEGAEFVMERVFDAPRELVWKVLTEAEHIPNWWGLRDRPMTVVEMDVRVGGTWRWVTSDSDGNEVPFTGEYLEIVPPERLVNTEMFDVEPFNAGEPAIVTQILEDLGGRTRLISRSRFSSADILEGVLSTGMVGGAIESWDRIAEELARIA